MYKNTSQGCIKILNVRQKRNSGKGYCMYTAHTIIKMYQQGGYFLVLDGDDFFTTRNKLQSQVEFLDHNPSYFGCGHEYVVSQGDTSMYVTARYREVPEFTKRAQMGVHNIEDYPDIYYYSHTSTMMYRNIFSDIDVPKYFIKPQMRGDSALLLWFFIMTKQRVGHMNMIGSCYNIHGQGIWSGVSTDEKISLTEKMVAQIASLTSNEEYKKKLKDIEMFFIGSIIREQNVAIHPCEIYKDFLAIILHIGEVIQQQQEENRIYMSFFVDNTLESLGKVYAVKNGIYRLGRTYKQEHIGILCSDMQEKQYMSKVYAHIESLISEGKNVHVFYTGVSNDLALTCKTYCEEHGVLFFQCVKEKYNTEEEFRDVVGERVSYYLSVLFTSMLSELHCYISPADIIASSCMQDGIAQKIIYHVFNTKVLAQGISASVVDEIRVEDEAYGIALQHESLLNTKCIRVCNDKGEEYVLSENMQQESDIAVVNIEYE